ncbi:proton channel OtopLc [Caerostris darwini]|uniref:Proton channel OtopLc n=1 Tax=Caerostris darwini TaxID=1538125 RepID=A0AAV4X5J6_9ARAC|nr:proton channel OtopLc [Caerostris darwini]
MNEMKQDDQTIIPARSDSHSSADSESSTEDEFQRSRKRLKDVPMFTYPPSMLQDSDVGYMAKKRRVSSPDGSMYDLDPSIEMTKEEKKKRTWKNLTTIYSIIYGMLLTVSGAIIYVNHQSPETRHVSEIFSICISIAGMLWLGFFHIDLYRYKQEVLKKLMGTADQFDRISTCTEFNYAITFIGNEIPPYRFLTGRHSGSFYLKAGMAAFCFGHLINEGLELGQQIIDFTRSDRYLLGCGEISSLIVHIVRPLYSFYQLFIVFKYSNIVINRHKMLACFAVMHIMATCLCFWFGTIVEDALEDYHHKLSKKENLTKNGTLASEYAPCTDLSSSQCKCATDAILSVNNVQAIPYLYPFTIEFNLLIAGVWFIMWHNIGKQYHRANPHHFHHKIHKNDGIEEVTYQSNLVISADCHASNKGLFAGLFILLSTIISIIVFFVAMSSAEYHNIGLSIHYFQESILIVITFFLCNHRSKATVEAGLQ